jgi:hypothetical protein
MPSKTLNQTSYVYFYNDPYPNPFVFRLVIFRLIGIIVKCLYTSLIATCESIPHN